MAQRMGVGARLLCLGHLGLELSGFLPVSLFSEFCDAHAGFGAEVCEPRDGPVGAYCVALEDEIGAATADEESFRTIGYNACELACVAARELHTDDVGVLGDGENRVRREVSTSCGAGEVVHQKRNGTLVGHRIEMLDDKLVREKTAVVARSCLPRALSAAACNERNSSTARFVEDGIPSNANDGGAF
ncbi:hypothetical protein HG530_014414 [Fusarium avenaceum]|nr:hypothetical protein HG530_014414 [Fusarium avenaceum]